jgi:NAD(P)H-flavin reductase
VDQYEHVLMVAGGSGITAILPYLQAFSTTPGRTRRINLVWIVKRAEYAMDVFSHELRQLDLDSITVSTSLFVTGSTDDEASRDSPDLTTLPTTGFHINASTPSSSAAMDSNGDKVESEKEKSSSDFDVNQVPVEVFRGRPQLNILLDQAFKQMVGDERLAVLTCGPSSMVDDLRQVVVSAYGLGEGRVRGSAVDYFEELFSW